MAGLGRLQAMKLVVQLDIGPAGSRRSWILESQSNVRQKVLVAFS